jgi:hypothetical protein
MFILFSFFVCNGHNGLRVGDVPRGAIRDIAYALLGGVLITFSECPIARNSNISINI